MELQGKVVIVTGASRGIGRQLALEFGRRGARVVLAARTVEPRRTLPGTLGETLDIIEASGGTAITVACDVADAIDIERLVTTTVDAFGGIDVVVNNAADMVGGDFEKLLEAMLGTATASADDARPPTPFDNWTRQFAINVHGPYRLMTLATPHLRANGGGVIVNITSESAELVPLDEALQRPSMNPSLGYGVTKAALNRLTNAAAASLAADRIAVVAVDPGVVHTEVRDLLDEGGIAFPEKGAPMSVPVAAVLAIVEADDPMTFSGQIVRAQP